MYLQPMKYLKFYTAKSSDDKEFTFPKTILKQQDY